MTGAWRPRDTASEIDVERVVDRDVRGRERWIGMRGTRHHCPVHPGLDRLDAPGAPAELLQEHHASVDLGRIGEAEHQSSRRANVLPPVDRLVEVDRIGLHEVRRFVAVGLALRDGVDKFVHAGAKSEYEVLGRVSPVGIESRVEDPGCGYRIKQVRVEA